MYDIIFVGNRDHKSFSKLRTRFPVSKQASTYEEAKKKSFTKFFWVVFPDLDICDTFNFDYEATDWDMDYVHIFKNNNTYDGVCLFSKTVKVSTREFDNRFFINKKEIDIVASNPLPYDIFPVKTYEDYLQAVDQSSLDMFWCTWDNLELDYNFDYYIPAYDSFHKALTHVFKNGEFYDGVCLFSKKKPITKREFNSRFFAAKKEVDIVASMPKPFEIVFISYFEPEADKNYTLLTEKVKHHIHRVINVEGIHNAHKQAASLVKTDMFWVVDADATIMPNFDFCYQVIKHNQDMVHVWRSCNPINDLEYGYGGVKLLPTSLTLNMDMSKPDMTTSISSKFKAVEQVSNITAFNTNEFNTWRSAFRECAKLASKAINGQVDVETSARLDVWCTVGTERPYGKYAISGALAGRIYGQDNAGNLPALSKVNDFKWLNDQFTSHWKDSGNSLSTS